MQRGQHLNQLCKFGLLESLTRHGSVLHSDNILKEGLVSDGDEGHELFKILKISISPQMHSRASSTGPNWLIGPNSDPNISQNAQPNGLKA